MSHTNPLSEVGNAFAAGLASAFGAAESFIAPIRNSLDAESTNKFGGANSKKNETESKVTSP